MGKNVGIADRIVRLLIVVITAVAFLKGWLKGKKGLVVAMAGFSLISSVISGYCPLYEQLGIATAPEEKSGH